MRRPIGSPELVAAFRKIESLRDEAQRQVEQLTADLEHQDEVLSDLVAERGRTHTALKTAQVELSGYGQALTRLQQY